jgi:hypothetical protein
MSAVTEVTIVRVDLVEESFKTYRDLQDEDPMLYPLMLVLSRPLDDFERSILFKWWQNIEFTEDRMQVLLRIATLEQVRDELEELNGRLASAIAAASEAREAAQAEDERLRALAAEINAALTQQ